MLTSLITHQRIVTTTPKAKELAPLADSLITLAKTNTLHTRRQASAILRLPASVTTLFEELGPRYGARDGGYTRVLKLSQHRAGDKADMSVIEYVDRPGEIRVARNNGYGHSDGFNKGKVEGGEGQISNGGEGLKNLIEDSEKSV